MNQRMACHAEISLKALNHNLEVIKKCRPEAEIVAMVKANAYGHGASRVAQHLAESGVKWFGVATVNEGIELRKNGLTSRILVMAGAGSGAAVPELLQFGLTPLVSSLAELRTISAIVDGSRLSTPFTIHIDIDTGLTRGGFLGLQASDLIAISPMLHIEGVSTHFAKAESPSCPFTAEQFAAFLDQLRLIAASGHKPSVIHVDKSASILTQRWTPPGDYTMLVRPGISLYGVDPTEGREFVERLQPVLSWQAPIVLRKHIAAGTRVGYDCTFTAQNPMEIALVRVGYADGLNRTLSNRGHLVVSDVKASILGRVSMDLTVIDVTEVVSQELTSAILGIMLTLLAVVRIIDRMPLHWRGNAIQSPMKF